MSDSKRIAKNTIFLYIRMLLIMAVTLYTSRVVLDKLGVEDYGLYNAVYGVVGMLSFITGTLSFGISRFITFELGAGNREKLKLTFSTALCANLVIAGILLVLLETIGLWFVHNKLVIASDRFDAATNVYQLSLVTMVFQLVQIPYMSGIIAHEKMNAYAYVSIFEAVGRLAVCYMISIGPFDKLVNYTVFLVLVQAITSFLYMLYSRYHFDESRFSLKFDKNILKNILSFSGWNIAANMSETFKLQGVIVLINVFFQPAVVAAQAVANQIAGGVMQFVNNFRIAIDPQIIKLYAAGDYEESKRLTLNSAVYTFDLILILVLPCFFTMNTILDLWLVDVPEYCVVFAQWAILQRIASSVGGALFTPLVAAGKIKKNSIYALLFCITQLVLLVIIFKLGGGVMWVQYLGLIFSFVFTFLVRPLILHVDVNYEMKDVVECFGNCAKVLIPSVLISVVIQFYVGDETLGHATLSFVLIMIAVASCAIAFMGIDDRKKLFAYMQKTLGRIKSK